MEIGEFNVFHRGKILLVAIPVVVLAFLVLGITPYARLPVAMPAIKVPVVKPPMPKVPVVTFEQTVKQGGSLVVATSNVRDAIDVVNEERARTRDERDAFDAFLTRIQRMNASQSMAAPGAKQTVVNTKPVTASQTTRIQDTYEETVMDVPHYSEEYGDTVDRSLAEEFGPAIAAAITTGQSFTPLFKQQLEEAAHESRALRDDFLERLNTEESALATARQQLEDLASAFDQATVSLPSEKSYEDLIDGYERLTAIEDDCTALLEERQRQRTTGHAALGSSRLSTSDLHSYLYGSLDVTYPVLADTTSFLEKVRRTRRQLTREFATRY